MTTEQKFSRGLSMPPHGWPQIQLEEMELYLAQQAMKDFPPDPLVADSLNESLKTVRAGAETLASPYGTAFTVNNK